LRVESCHNCGCKESKYYAEENGYTLVKCDDCGLLYVNERPDDEEITESHKQGEHAGDKKFNVTGRYNKSRIPPYMKMLGDIYQGDLGETKTWLDVGCGYGEFLEAVNQYSGGKISAVGTEPNLHKQESARGRGLDVGYFDLGDHDKKYDVVSMLNLYSHLPNPPSFVEMVKGLLNPGGEIIMETGDTADFPADKHFRPFYLPDHLSFGSEKIVSDVLRQQGFEILNVQKYPFLKLDSMTLFKECAKLFLPGHPSKVRHYFHYSRYAKMDMFIRAKLVE